MNGSAPTRKIAAIGMVLIAAALMSAPAASQAASAPPSTPASASVDPARLAEARLVAAKLLPPGVYRTLMSSTMSPIIDNMGETFKALPLRQIAEIGGLDPARAAALDTIDVEALIAIYDPHWRERSQLAMRAMFGAMGEFFTTLEPELREAYAAAYANRFTLAELRDLNAFFRTSSGAKFAGGYITIGADPAIVTQMRDLMPKMIQQMPIFLAAAQKATAALPPPRKLKDLTAAEKATLAKALGVPEGQLKDPKGTP